MSTIMIQLQIASDDELRFYALSDGKLTINTDQSCDIYVEQYNGHKQLSVAKNTQSYEMPLTPKEDFDEQLLQITAVNAAGDSSIEFISISFQDQALTLLVESIYDGKIMADKDGHFLISGVTEPSTVVVNSLLYSYLGYIVT